MAPLPGELSAKLTERLSQICRERPKPQIQFAVWKGRNEHRGKETSLAAARSVVVVSAAPPAAPSFPSCRKRRGRKGALGYIWCILPLNLGEALFFRCRSTRWSPYGFFDYAPPDTGVPNLQLVSVEYLPSIEGALEIQMNVTFLRGKAPLPGADSPYQGEMSRRDKRGRDAGSAQPRLRGCWKFAIKPKPQIQFAVWKGRNEHRG